MCDLLGRVLVLVLVCMGGGGTLPFRMCTNQAHTLARLKTKYTHAHTQSAMVIICCKDFNISECIDGTMAHGDWRCGGQGSSSSSRTKSNVSRNSKAAVPCPLPTLVPIPVPVLVLVSGGCSNSSKRKCTFQAENPFPDQDLGRVLGASVLEKDAAAAAAAAASMGQLINPPVGKESSESQSQSVEM